MEKSQHEVFLEGQNIQTMSPIDSFRDKLYMTDPLRNPLLAAFDCSKLFDNEENEMNNAIRYLNAANNNFIHTNDMEYEKHVMDCDKFKQSRGYRQTPDSETEREFPLAFNILFYQNIEQLERLLRAIYRPQNQYCIHVDKKTPQSIIETVQHLTDCFDNVFLASKLEIVVYASYTRLLADINCMRDHIENGYEWKYLLNMAASEFPIMTNLQIVQILKEFNGANDIHEVFITMDENRFRKKHFTYIDVVAKKGHMIHTKVKKEEPPHKLTITKGNAYNVFSKEFVKFVLKDKIAKDLLAWSADTFTPDEHYWATLNNLYSNPFLETPGGYKGHPDNKPFFGRYIGWNTTKHLPRCKAGHFIHNVCVFSVQDLPMIRNRPEIIANKFDIDYDPLAYRCMEEWLHNKTINRVSISHATYYRRLSAKS